MTIPTATNTPNATPPLRVVVLGGGSFGSAIANLAARKGCDTAMWIRDPKAAQEMQESGKNTRYLADFDMHENINYFSDLAEAVLDRDLILMAIPSHSFRKVLQQLAPLITGQVVVSMTKGIEPISFDLMSDIIQQELPNVAFGVLSGPNLAKEIMQGMPAGTVIASDSEAVRHVVHEALASPLFRVFASTDVHGVELGGALKNIYAVAMGMGAAYNLGENTRAMLLTRALAEMSRFAVRLGANPLTFLGLSGVGDLFATCSSPLSRNFQIGFALGQGKTLEEAVFITKQTAEGINTIQQVRNQAIALGVYMPITNALYEVIFEGKPPLGIALMLMQTGHRSDVEFVLPHQNPDPIVKHD